ncbi:hypothetical protein [Flavobacterium reichenbachii]|uniref:hypothetical protein n=1 Tax=Flavobacterium reichenbachii TaxID=362418 RepID=UPI000B6C6962|nr:hypothetical protein [Flavobacterium reichenbachii]OXB15784.1 hypothetical protein B0A68_08960 [Flavobacterium reichenbachii]
MKKNLYILALIILFCVKASAKIIKIGTIDVNEYESSVTFPAGYNIGDYIEFVRVNPLSAGASGNYQISIHYLEDGIASAATHLASISHSNPPLWREVGRVNNNAYVGVYTNFTVDCNTEYGNSRFRIRTVGTHASNRSITVYIRITSINSNGSFTALNSKGNDSTVLNFLPMTCEWDLYVGNNFTSTGASLAIKAIQNGNVGIGISNPKNKLDVNGIIHSKEVKVDMDGWSDFVFTKEYNLPTLQEVEKHINEKGHLENIPSEDEVLKNGINLGEMNSKLLQKIEEMTLYIIEQNKRSNELMKRLEKLEIKK